MFAFQWLIQKSCDQRHGRNLEIMSKKVSQKLEFPYFVPMKLPQHAVSLSYIGTWFYRQEAGSCKMAELLHEWRTREELSTVIRFCEHKTRNRQNIRRQTVVGCGADVMCVQQVRSRCRGNHRCHAGQLGTFFQPTIQPRIGPLGLSCFFLNLGNIF